MIMQLRLTIFILLLSVVLMAFQCRKEGVNTRSFKGRLEIKGMCSNYTIKVLDGPVDTTQIQANWTDPSTGKAYQNVFGLGSPCTFPADINEGDEFYFVLANEPQNCAVCMAFYPTPSRRLNIKVSKTPIQ